ncbi:MAG: type IV secretory system conjugative DNA transfer family protein [Gordonia sp. (in: high G+C Gram-positive bacteria)]
MSTTKTRRKQPATASDTPYVGLIDIADGAVVVDDEANAGARKGDLAAGAVHTLVSGRTGSGKSRSCLAPAAIMWGERPVVCVSSKGDLAELTAPKRSRRGPAYLMDLSGEVRDAELRDAEVTRVASDPVALIDSDDAALEMAALLLEVGSLGAGGGGAGGGGDSFWQSLAMRPLAAILRAAGTHFEFHDHEAVETAGGGISWALAACEDVGDDDGPTEDLDPHADEDLSHPDWDNAYLRAASVGSRHAQSLLSAKAMDPRQRDSIAINMRVALGAWALEAVAGDGSLPAFTPDMLEAKGATLYVVSPLAGAAAPAASATLTGVVNHWRKRVGEVPAVLMVIDECPNTSPLPRLANWVGEARGLNIRLLVAVQATSQFEPRWGAAGMKILRETFPSILILPGAPEREILELAAWAGGQEHVGSGSIDAAGRASLGSERTERYSSSGLLPSRKGEGRLILSGRPGVRVYLPDIAATNLLD